MLDKRTIKLDLDEGVYDKLYASSFSEKTSANYIVNELVRLFTNNQCNFKLNGGQMQLEKCCKDCGSNI